MSTKDEMAQMLAAVAHLSYGLMLSAQAPAGKWVYERSKNVRPGDLVVEMTIHKWNPASVGWLDRISVEPMYASDEWDEELEGRPIPIDTYYYVRPLTGGPVTRWMNCQFIALPTDYGTSSKWGEDTPSAIAWHEDFQRRWAAEHPEKVPA